MRKAKVFFQGHFAGVLYELDGKRYGFTYEDYYDGLPVSLTMPVSQKTYEFDQFPTAFEGLLPEGFQLDALLKRSKIDRHDYFSQLVTTGRDLVGAITIEEIR